MPEHVHVHVPHELTEGNEGGTKRERILEIVAALLMSVATLGIAWSGYQARALEWRAVAALHRGERGAQPGEQGCASKVRRSGCKTS